MKLVRDKQEHNGQVTGREEYIDLLKGDAVELLLMVTQHKGTQQELYEKMADFFELYQTLHGQLLTTGSELGTKARHKKQFEVSKSRAEQFGGYFNGLLK